MINYVLLFRSLSYSASVSPSGGGRRVAQNCEERLLSIIMPISMEYLESRCMDFAEFCECFLKKKKSVE